MKIYKPSFTPEFLSQAKKYRHFKKIMANKLALLCSDPYTTCKSEMLVGELKGLRSARLTKSFRIIFAICEECRARKTQSLVGCQAEICAAMETETIVFLTVGPHEDAYS